MRFAPVLALTPGTRERLVRIEAVTNPSLSRPQARVLQPTITMVMSAFLCSVNLEKQVHLVATFEEPVSKKCFRAVKRLVEMWAIVLSFGGFPGAGLPFSMGSVSRVYWSWGR